MLRRPPDGLDDVVVAGASAQLTADRLADGLLAGIGVAVQQPAGRDHHRGRAEPALQSVALHEPLLDRIEPVGPFHPLDRVDRMTIGHHAEHGAALDRRPVEEYDARPAVGRVTAPVGAMEAEVVAQQVHEQDPRLDVPGAVLTVDCPRHVHGVPPPRRPLRAAGSPAVARCEGWADALILPPPEPARLLDAGLVW